MHYCLEVALGLRVRVPVLRDLAEGLVGDEVLRALTADEVLVVVGNGEDVPDSISFFTDEIRRGSPRVDFLEYLVLVFFGHGERVSPKERHALLVLRVEVCKLGEHLFFDIDAGARGLLGQVDILVHHQIQGQSKFIMLGLHLNQPPSIYNHGPPCNTALPLPRCLGWPYQARSVSQPQGSVKLFPIFPSVLPDKK